MTIEVVGPESAGMRAAADHVVGDNQETASQRHDRALATPAHGEPTKLRAEVAGGLGSTMGSFDQIFEFVETLLLRNPGVLRPPASGEKTSGLRAAFKMDIPGPYSSVTNSPSLWRPFKRDSIVNVLPDHGWMVMRQTEKKMH
jgi:hypothetical protein